MRLGLGRTNKPLHSKLHIPGSNAAKPFKSPLKIPSSAPTTAKSLVSSTEATKKEGSANTASTAKPSSNSENIENKPNCTEEKKESAEITTANQKGIKKPLATPKKQQPSTSGSFKKPVQKETTREEKIVEDVDPNDIRCFEVLWCKISKKKHKTYSDGILVAKKNTLYLKDNEGKDLGKTQSYSINTIASLGIGNTVEFAGKEIEITSIRKGEDFSSGRIFSRIVAPTVIDERPASAQKKIIFKNPGSHKPPTPAVEPTPLFNPCHKDSFVLFQPDAPKDKQGLFQVPVVLDPAVTRLLRPHQKEGIKFMYNCLTGRSNPGYYGCILADEMGLGKTLQTIAVVQTLITQGRYGEPTCRKAVIVTPSSLVENWKKEFSKWLGIKCKPLVICGKMAPKQVKESLTFFEHGSQKVLILSYGLFRQNAELLHSNPKIDLIVCDEGHKLKCGSSKINNAIIQMPAKRRIILSGTPIQNDLSELFEIVELVCPSALGTRQSFALVYERPILASREPTAGPDVKRDGMARAEELSRQTNAFILRRTSEVNQQYLPPKEEQIVFCKLSEIQTEIYRSALRSKTVKGLMNVAEKQKLTVALDCLQGLQKLCNHPDLIFHKIRSESESVFSQCGHLFPTDYDPNQHAPEMSGKLKFLDALLHELKNDTKDRIVVVSNFTKTLDIIEKLCKTRNYQFLRLDGKTPTGKRMELVDRFNSPFSSDFAFLLSSKAGGVGLNLIGANRIVLFDPDWNPANDAQAMARVWREGQKKTVYIYRLICTGTLEEKIFQRQITKTGLSRSVVDESTNESRHFSSHDLKKIFTFNRKTLCETHEMIKCKCLSDLENAPKSTDQDTGDSEEIEITKGELAEWRHFPNMKDSKDNVLVALASNEKFAENVTFIFGCTYEANKSAINADTSAKPLFDSEISDEEGDESGDFETKQDKKRKREKKVATISPSDARADEKPSDSMAIDDPPTTSQSSPSSHKPKTKKWKRTNAVVHDHDEDADNDDTNGQKSSSSMENIVCVTGGGEVEEKIGSECIHGEEVPHENLGSECTHNSDHAFGEKTESECINTDNNGEEVADIVMTSDDPNLVVNETALAEPDWMKDYES